MSHPVKGRVIFHVDMNSFYASVEAAFDPSLRNKPVAIAGNPKERKGIIVTCSYEARAYGVKTTMNVWEAKKICPELIIKPPNFERYKKASIAMFEVLRTYTSLVEPVSIDEGYMDVTDVKEHPLTLAKKIQQRLLDELLLPCSIGIAPNKFLAKMASNMKKPLGITVLRKRDLKEKLWPLSVGEMHGVGEKTKDKLHSIGIYTIGQLAKGNDIQLENKLGINGKRLKNRANGIDERPVDPNSIYDFKSVGNSTTLPYDLNEQEEIKQVLEKLSESVSFRLKRKGVVMTKISLTIRYNDRQTITRSLKMENPTDHKKEIYDKALYLFLKHWNGEYIRLLGITGQDVIEKKEAYKQLNLFSFEQDAKEEPLEEALFKIKEKFGQNAIKRGLNRLKGKEISETSFNKDFLQDEDQF